MSADLIGASPKFRTVLDDIALVAGVDSTVLVLGETGTGKGLVARAIHDAGSRRQRPFVAVNCAALPAPLLESELFGHERGAFTGAIVQTRGRFQAADGGTLFLDEIGDLPLEMQPKLLRALQERQVERLGSGGRPVSVDVRVIAATNQDLWEMVQRGAFRADLYYRLNVFPIVVPALRERSDDIPLLIEHFVRRLSARLGKPAPYVPVELMESLRQRAWRGNIRELENVIERAVITSTGGVLQAPLVERPQALLPMSLRHEHATAPAWTLADVTREHIVATLRETNWVVGGSKGAAARLGMCRTTLIAKMQRLGISREAMNPARLQTPEPRV
jgi:formate hydrogenlyase transcriptional activator